MNNTTTDNQVPGPADIFCPKCGRYHASITCCTEQPEATPTPTRPEAVQEAMKESIKTLFATSAKIEEFANKMKAEGRVPFLSAEDILISDVAAYVRELEAERERLKITSSDQAGEILGLSQDKESLSSLVDELKAELAEARKGRG